MNSKIFERLNEIRHEYTKNTNLIRFIKENISVEKDSTDPILVSYDFQSGTYIDGVKKNQEFSERYTSEVANIINSLSEDTKSVMEVGCGELTTLTKVANKLRDGVSTILGFDISLSRIYLGKSFFNEFYKKKSDNVFFVADLFNIPLADNSVDIVYTSHSIEPNGGREEEAIRELLRVTGKYLVLFEPSFENACAEGKQRMEYHGYIKDIKGAIASIGANLIHHSKVSVAANKLNPTWVHIIKKDLNKSVENKFSCPFTKEALVVGVDSYFVPNAISYPIIHGIPYLLKSHAILSSKVGK